MDRVRRKNFTRYCSPYHFCPYSNCSATARHLAPEMDAACHSEIGFRIPGRPPLPAFPLDGVVVIL